MFIKTILALIITVLFSLNTYAFNQEESVMFFGGSYVNKKVNYNEGLDTPLFGSCTKDCTYLDLGQAFSKHHQSITNEAWAGDGTFARGSYLPAYVPEIGGINLGDWPGMTVQIQRALMRSGTTSKYAFIDIFNDCVHSNAFGVPQEQTSPCTSAELNDVVTRLIEGGKMLEAAGIKVFYNKYPPADRLDFDAFLNSTDGLLLWAINSADWDELRNIHMTRIAAEMPDAVLVDCYEKMDHIGDGLHPDRKSMQFCALQDLIAIKKSEK